MKKIVGLLFTALALAVLPASKKAEACTGARQIGMGSAGVASCEDSHAVYWNQARLPLLDEAEVSYTQQIGEKENARYDNVLSLTSPINERLGVGVQYVMSSKGTLNRDKWKEDFDWIKFALGYILKDGRTNSPSSWTHSIGGAITPKIIEFRERKNGQETLYKESIVFYDISCLAEKTDMWINEDKLSLGILIRTGRIAEEDEEDAFRLAIRPGACYRLPNRFGDFTISAEYYGVKGAAGPRFGIEQVIGNEKRNISLRAGYEDVSNSAFMAGLGIKHKNLGANIVWTDKKVGWIEIFKRF